jgi:hypothetical protein
MLAALGLVGKAVELLVSTVAKKKLELALDDKKRAAKAFVRLHESILELERIGEGFLGYIDRAKHRSNPKIYEDHLDDCIKSLKAASIEFVAAMRQVTPVLSLYSPELETMLGAVAVGKRGALKNFFYLVQSSIAADMASQDLTGPDTTRDILRFDMDFVERRFASLSMTLPKETFLENAGALMEQGLAGRPGNAFSDERLFFIEYRAAGEPPLKIDLFEVVCANLESVQIDCLDNNKLIDLYPRLRRQQDIIRDARESLRKFIEANFSLTDVRYVSQ